MNLRERDDAIRRENLFEPSWQQRTVLALFCLGLGLLLVQILFGWIAIKVGLYVRDGSIVFLKSDFFIIPFLIICAVAGWIKGQPVVDRLYEEIENWDWLWRRWR